MYHYPSVIIPERIAVAGKVVSTIDDCAGNVFLCKLPRDNGSRKSSANDKYIFQVTVLEYELLADKENICRYKELAKTWVRSGCSLYFYST